MNYTSDELREMGVRLGDNVRIHKTVQIFNPDRLTLGSNVRIDCFCVISAGEPVIVGNYVHLAVGVNIVGGAGVEISNFVGLSSRVSVFSTSDDYSDGYMTNPTVPDRFRKITSAKVVLGEHAIVGAGSIIMPGVTLARGVAVGALSFVNKSVPEFYVVSGNPVRQLGTRNRERLLMLEEEFLRSATQK